MRILFSPWLISLLLPFAFAAFARQPWKRRPLYIVIGVLIAWAVAWTYMFFWTLADVGLRQVGLGSGSDLVPRVGGLSLSYWVGLALAYIVNFGVTGWALKALLPRFRDSSAPPSPASPAGSSHRA